VSVVHVLIWFFGKILSLVSRFIWISGEFNKTIRQHSNFVKL